MRSIFCSRIFAIVALGTSLAFGAFLSVSSGIGIYLAANLLALGASGRFSSDLGLVLTVTAANVVASAQATIRREYLLAYAAATAGQLVYLNSSNKWALVDVDGNLGVGANDLRGFTLGGGGLDQPVAVATEDPDYTPGATLTNGKTVYGFTTAGGISEADVPTTGGYPVVCGVAKSTTKMILKFIATGVVI